MELFAFYQPRRIETINPGEARIAVGKMAGQGAQIAVFADELIAAEDFDRTDGCPLQARFAHEQIGDDHFIFLRLERTGAVDERPARLGQSERAIEQTALQRR